MKPLGLGFIILCLGFALGRFTSPARVISAPEKSDEERKLVLVAEEETRRPTPPAARKPETSPSPVSPSPTTVPTASPNSEPPVNSIAEEKESETSASVQNVRPDYRDLDPRAVENLERLRRRNLSRAINRSQPVREMDANVRGLIGTFEGDILLDAGRTWQISIQTQGRIAQNSFQGTCVVKLIRSGRVFSTNANDGTIKNIRTVGGDRTSLIIQVNEEHYLDVAYDGNSDSLFGNFYGKNDRGEPRYRGYALLTRK